MLKKTPVIFLPTHGILPSYLIYAWLREATTSFSIDNTVMILSMMLLLYDCLPLWLWRPKLLCFSKISVESLILMITVVLSSLTLFKLKNCQLLHEMLFLYSNSHHIIHLLAFSISLDKFQRSSSWNCYFKIEFI